MSILISVVIPCYNHGKYITKAIQSVLEYEFPEEVEILVINDGSTDPETLKVLSELSDPHVQVYHQENKGLAKSRNRGVQLAQGRYILPLDSDNYIKHEYIGISKQILDARRDIDVVYCDRIIFNDHSNVYQKVPEYSLKEILFGNKIDACAVFRKSMWESLGGYDEFMPVMGYEDWDFWIRAGILGSKFYRIPQGLFYYRDLPDSMIKNTEKKNELATSYVISKHAQTYSKYLFEIGKEYSYLKRKPLRYLLKRIFSKKG